MLFVLVRIKASSALWSIEGVMVLFALMHTTLCVLVSPTLLTVLLRIAAFLYKLFTQNLHKG